MNDIAVYGAGGFGREVACLIRLINESMKVPRWRFIGFFDDNDNLKGCTNEYGRIIGGRGELNSWPTTLDVAIAIGSPSAVKKVVESIDNPNVDFPNVIAPSVTWLDQNNVKIGKGNILCTNCMVSCNVTIGNFNLFNGYIPIGHDTIIGDYNVIMPSVNISGGIKMGNCNFFGVGCAILQYIRIGNSTRVGAGSVVMRNTKDGFLYVGTPAKKMEL